MTQHNSNIYSDFRLAAARKPQDDPGTQETSGEFSKAIDPTPVATPPKKGIATQSHDDFVDSLITKTKAIQFKDSSSANRISNNQLKQVLQDICTDRKCKEEEALTAMALLAQMGATSSKSQKEVSVTLNDTIFPVNLIKDKIKIHTGKSFRRLAKTYAEAFAGICESQGQKGNLLNKLKLYYPDFQTDEKGQYYASDFQSENDKCPSNVRHYLNRYYNEYINTKRVQKK